MGSIISLALAAVQYVFVRKWGSFCNKFNIEDCVDPDGPGPLQKGQGQFYYPEGIDIDSSGNVYVSR